MRRHHAAESVESQCHIRTPNSEISLPTTLSPTLVLHTKETRKRKKQQQRQGPFLVQKDGMITIRPSVISGFLFVGVLALFGIHLYLLGQISKSSSTSSPGPIVQPDSKSHNNELNERPRILSKLRPIDKDKYTIRVNTWQRLDELLVSIDHHASCPGVAQIQVVWCEPTDPPISLLQLHPEKVVIERHEVNSLNERFNILPTTNTPTLGILSMDDDVLRSCEAIDSGFFQWIQSPSRMVGFDFRVHVPDVNGTWKYGYLSETQKKNRYSMSLPRYAFIHKDYLDWYMKDLPRPIFDHVAESFNCEDIAMSLFISSHTDGLPPLLAHFWAMESMVKLWSPKKISGTKEHKSLRDGCVESFAQQLDLKNRLMRAAILHRNDTMFYCGDRHRNSDLSPIETQTPNLRGDKTEETTNQRQEDHFLKINQWRQLSAKEVGRKIAEIQRLTSRKAKAAGLIENTKEWEEKFRKKH